MSGFFMDAGDQIHLLCLLHKLSPWFPPVSVFKVVFSLICCFLLKIYFNNYNLLQIIFKPNLLNYILFVCLCMCSIPYG